MDILNDYYQEPGRRRSNRNAKFNALSIVLTIGFLALLNQTSNNGNIRQVRRLMVQQRHQFWAVNSQKYESYDDNSIPTTTTKRRRPYHSWGPEGADIHELLRLFNISYQDTMAQVNPYKGQGMLQNLFVQYQPFPALLALNNNTPRLLVPNKAYAQVQNGNAKRLKMVIQYFQRALAIQLYQHQDKFPSLVHALKTVGSIPLGMDLGDYRGCLDPTWNEFNQSSPKYDVKEALEANIPLLTVSRNFDCPYGFAIPNYGDYQVMNIMMATTTTNNGGSWESLHQEWNATFPWQSKRSQIYWRGGLKFSRHDMMATVKQRASTTAEYLDIQQTGCQNLVGDPFCSAKEPPETSMKYKAVLDMDGNSWSDRFPRLLCYNSAVVKIQLPEDYEEYFMADLEPNVHYIPASLENFTQVAELYLSQEKDAFLQEIVQNANAFCRERFTEERLNLDFLTILDSYVETLNQYQNANLCKENDQQPCWMQIWLDEKESYIGSTAQDKHQGFTDLCNRPNIPSLTEGSNMLWDLETYEIPVHDIVCP